HLFTIPPMASERRGGWVALNCAHRASTALSCALCEHRGQPGRPEYNYSLISTSTPAAKFNFIRASIVSGVGSMMSNNRLWVLISNCSRDFLSTWVDRRTVHFSIRVVKGIGLATLAPLRLTVSTISATDWSSTR